ncbi:hypothetical protein D3C80_1853210 [compost metagenome]
MHGNITFVAAFTNPPQALGQCLDAGGASGQLKHVAPTQHGIGQQRQFVALAGNGDDKAAQAPRIFQPGFGLVNGLAGKLR